MVVKGGGEQENVLDRILYKNTKKKFPEILSQIVLYHALGHFCILFFKLHIVQNQLAFRYRYILHVWLSNDYGTPSTSHSPPPLPP